MLSGKSMLPMGDHASIQGISEGDAWFQMLESRILCRVTDSVERRMDEQAQPVRHCDYRPISLGLGPAQFLGPTGRSPFDAAWIQPRLQLSAAIERALEGKLRPAAAPPLRPHSRTSDVCTPPTHTPESAERTAGMQAIVAALEQRVRELERRVDALLPSGPSPNAMLAAVDGRAEAVSLPTPHRLPRDTAYSTGAPHTMPCLHPSLPRSLANGRRSEYVGQPDRPIFARMCASYHRHCTDPCSARSSRRCRYLPPQPLLPPPPAPIASARRAAPLRPQRHRRGHCQRLMRQGLPA